MNMTARFTLTIILILAMTSCAEIQRYEIRRTVKDNQFSSTFPDLKVKIDPQLSYLGSAERTAEDTSVHPNSSDLQDSTVSYLFGQLDPNGVLQKGTLIRLVVIRGDPSKAHDELSGRQVKSPLDSGSVRILDDEYDYLLYACQDMFTEKEAGILPGGSIASCYLIKLLEKRVGLGNKSLVQVFYFEDATFQCSNIPCDACLQGSDARPWEEQFLSGFVERSYHAISFMEPKKMVDETSKYVKPKDSKKEPADVIPPVTETMGHPESIENRLKVLKDLLDKNLITRDDYEKKKAAILEGL